MAKWLSSTSVEKGWLESEREREKKDQEQDFKEEKRNFFDREKCVGGENIAGTTQQEPQ